MNANPTGKSSPRWTSRPVWQRAMDLVAVAYEVAERLPASERYVLSSQLRRAAVSVVANITEGYARSGPRQLRAFLDIAYASARECEVLLHVAVRVKKATETDIAAALAAVDVVSRQLNMILRSLREPAEDGSRSV